MSDVLMVIFTGVLAASTIIYTVMSHRQWKATRASVDLARITGFINVLIQFHNFIEHEKLMGQPTAMWEQAERLVVEVGIEEFLKDIDLRKNQHILAYYSNIEGLLRAGNIDPESVWWFRPVVRKIKDNSYLR